MVGVGVIPAREKERDLMPSVKTAISIEEPLYRELDNLAKEMKISRSRIFSRAAQEYIQHCKSRKLLNDLNEAYGDLPDAEEETLKARMRSRHRELVKNQW